MSKVVIRVPAAEAAALIEQRGWTQGEYERKDDGVCLHGAIRLCCPVPGDAQIIEQVAQRRGRGTYWNDEPGRFAAEVLGSLRTEPWDVTDTDLAETFGPQWQQIVVLVRRAAVLTPEEVWDAAGARAAARAAAGLAVRDLIGQHGLTQANYDTLTGPWRKRLRSERDKYYGLMISSTKRAEARSVENKNLRAALDVAIRERDALEVRLDDMRFSHDGRKLSEENAVANANRLLTRAEKAEAENKRLTTARDDAIASAKEWERRYHATLHANNKLMAENKRLRAALQKVALGVWNRGREKEVNVRRFAREAMEADRE